MRKAFLHYVWEHQVFLRKKWYTIDGIPIQVLSIGKRNTEEGPDFLQAKILLGGIPCSGDISLEEKLTPFLIEKEDPSYKDLLLRVVWKLPKHVDPVHHRLNSLPIVALADYTLPEAQITYKKMMKKKNYLIGSSSRENVSPALWDIFLERTMKKKIEYNFNRVFDLLQDNHGDSQATTYQWLAAGLGEEANRKACLKLTQLLPFDVIKHHLHDLNALQVLLLGQAGFLEGEPENDTKVLCDLREQWNRLRRTHLLPRSMSKQDWCLAYIPNISFPPLKLIQFSSILHKYGDDLLHLLCDPLPKRLIKKLKTLPIPPLPQGVTPTPILLYRTLRLPAIHDLLTEVAVPLLVTYNTLQGHTLCIKQAIQYLKELPPKKNKIITHLTSLGCSFADRYTTEAIDEAYITYLKDQQEENDFDVYLQNQIKQVCKKNIFS